MSAYVLVDVEVFDHERARDYQVLAEPSIAQYGGKYLVKGATPEATEGIWPTGRHLVALEFSDMKQAKEWYTSPEYAEAIKIRTGIMDIRILFADGVSA